MKQTALNRKTPLKARKRLNPISDKQRERNALWKEITDQKAKDLDYICQWCGLPGKRDYGYAHLDGHHTIKRRYRIDTPEICYVCHQIGCHPFIEEHNIDVRIYPNKKAWEQEVEHES